MSSHTRACAIRTRIEAFASSHGYRVSGNHLFDRWAWARIEAGAHAWSVSERPDRHPAKIAAAARALQRTFEGGAT